MIGDSASISGTEDMSRARLCVRLCFLQDLVPSLSVLELAFDKILLFALRYAITCGIKEIIFSIQFLYFN